MKVFATLAFAATTLFATATAQGPFAGPQYPNATANNTNPTPARPRGTPRVTELTSLHNFLQAKGKLYLGTTSDRFLLTNTTNSRATPSESSSGIVIDKVFGQLTPENSMKWQSTEPQPNQFTLDDADFLVKYALERRIGLRGHTLVWHSQLPPWVENITDAEELTRVIQNHIAGVMGRYKGMIRSWDVVNEIFAEDGSFRNSVFFRVLGDSFVRIAFEAARRADPEAKLYINDFNLDSAKYPKLAVGMVPNVRRWLAEGVPIDGIGTQTHLQANQSAGVQAALEALASTGVKEIAITELDILNAPPKDYVDTIQACINVKSCVGITVWGVSDGDSWRKGENPLLFDSDFRGKPAYRAVVNTLCGGSCIAS